MNTLNIILSLIASILLFLMSAFVLYKDWRDQINRYFVFYGLSAMGILLMMFLSYAFPADLSLTLLNRLSQLFTTLFFASVLIMSLVFPKGEKKFPLGITMLVLLPAFITGGIAVFTDWTITRAYFNANGDLEREFRFFYRVYAVVSFSYLLAGTINFIRKYIVTKVRVHRLQMRYIFVGVSIAVVVAAVCSIVLPLVFGYAKLYVIGPSIASFIAAVSLFYSVAAYSLMDIRSAVHKTAMYTIISMVIFVPIYGILEAAERDMIPGAGLPEVAIPLLIVAVFILFSVAIQPIIDRLFKRKQYQFESVVDGFIREMEKVYGVSEIIQRTIDLLVDSLNLRKVFFILLNDASRKYELYRFRSAHEETGAVSPLDRNTSLVRWFVRNQEILHLDRVYTDDKNFGDIRDDIINFFNTNDVQLIMPYYHEKRLVGFLCLGEKENLAAYHPDEIEKLQEFLKKSTDFISTALSHEKAMKEQMLSRTLELSSNLQSSTVPQSLPRLNEMKFGAFIVPKYAEGCDYFDFIRPGDQGIGVIVTDIAGIGVNSSLYSVLLKSGMLASLPEAPATASLIQNLNKLLYWYSQGKGGLVTAFYVYYDFKSMRLMFTNAGFPAMEVYRIEKSNFDTLDTEGIPLGYDPDVAYGTGRTNLQKGDIGVLYTKTLINSKNQKGEEFGLLRLRGVISENRMRNAADIADIVKKAFQEFMGVSAPDSDVIVLIFKVL